MPRHLVRWPWGLVTVAGRPCIVASAAVVVVELVDVEAIADGYLFFVAGRRLTWAAPTSVGGF